MAWYRCGGGTGYNNKVTLHSGKIEMRTGVIEADNDYYYSDFFNAPNGKIKFDLGGAHDAYIGIEMCNSSGTHVDYLTTSNGFREVDYSTYYSQAPKLRLSFKVSDLYKVMIIDEVNNTMYFAGDFIKIAE